MLRSLSGFKSVFSVSKFVEAKFAITDTFHGCSYLTFRGFQGSYILSIVRQFHSSLPRKKDDKRSLISSAPVKDDGTSGERAINIDALIQSRRDMFPTEETPDTLFRGIPFKEVPIVNIRVSRNNTIFSLSDGKTGEVKVYRSCGIEGFKNTRKGTNIAAQATAISFTSMILNRGFKTVRVRVQGLGPGRMSSIKGLQMGGLDIISVTDSTRVSENPPRPRKRRRL
uniref:28S ribosomal protein S11, mitochondrial n=1 Tax=Cuerna arida TaxID=1464854 RepID=A0A1B6G247_9HEMI